MRYDAMYSDRTMPAIRRNLLPHSSALTMAAVSYADMSIQFYHTTQCHNTEDTVLHSCCNESLKAHLKLVMCHIVWRSEVSTTFALYNCR